MTNLQEVPSRIRFVQMKSNSMTQDPFKTRYVPANFLILTGLSLL